MKVADMNASSCRHNVSREDLKDECGWDRAYMVHNYFISTFLSKEVPVPIVLVSSDRLRKGDELVDVVVRVGSHIRDVHEGIRKESLWVEVSQAGHYGCTPMQTGELKDVG